MNHRDRRILHALLLSLIMALGGAASLFAADIAAGYGGAYIWPNPASANSERYFRCLVTWNPTSESLTNLSLSTSAGSYQIVGGSAPTDTASMTELGIARHTVSSSSSSITVLYTVGPFAGYDMWNVPHTGTICADRGRALATNGMLTGEANDDTGRFTGTITTSSGSTALDSGQFDVTTVHDNQDYLQWFSGDAQGIDPLSVDPVEITPDDGTGSSRFRFRVRYGRKNSGSNLRPRTGRYGAYPPGHGSGYTFVEYDYWDYDNNPATRYRLAGDRLDDDWSYTRWDDKHSLDRVGWDSNWGGQDPETVLIIDGDRTRPRFMHKEDPSDTNYNDGMVYFYDILPTDYKRFIDNILLFPYDPGGDDELDRFAHGLRGRPMSNNYVSLAAGGHTYEFLASDDFSPPNGHNTWEQVGQPGQALYNDYLRVNHVNNEADNVEVTRVYTRYNDSDGASGGSGYPYNSQDPTKYPKVDPVLSAHPYFPSGTIRPGSGFNPDPFGLNGSLITSPFTLDFNGGPNPPQRYTNDDTILPNFMNIFPNTSLTPFRGGKWTNGTTYTLRINYWQSQNIAPAFIRVFIRRNDGGNNPGSWQAYTMEQLNPADTSYNVSGGGCVFQFQTTPEQLPGGGGPGDYNYYFVANDGTRTTTFPNRPGVYNQPGGGAYYDPGQDAFSTTLGQPGVPTSAAGEDYYWFRVNTPPVLSSELVSPAAGRAGENFQFQVDYKDVNGEVLSGTFGRTAMGDRPLYARIVVDLFGEPLGRTSIVTAGTDTLTYNTVSSRLYADNALVSAEIPYYIEILTGAGAGHTYQIMGNTGNTLSLAAGTDLTADGVVSGTTFRIAQWFRGTMSPKDSLDVDYADGATYIFNTATNVELGAGVHRYYFEFTDDWGSWLFPNDSNVKIEGEGIRYPTSGYFEGPEVRENTAPILRDFRFTPQSTTGGADGTTATGFTFSVTYEDQENDPPALIRLGIDGTATTPAMVLDMTPDPANDNVYTDGATYKTQPTKLAEGTHIFYAQASDGKARFPVTAPGDPLIFSGPEIAAVPGTYEPSVAGPTVVANTPPTLSFEATDDGTDPTDPPGLSPNTGTSATTFTYSVIYTDTDRFAGVAGNPPKYVSVYIDDVEHAMTKVDATDSDYTNGALYQFTISGLIQGTPHTYFFLASDDSDRARLPLTGVLPARYNGPVVDEPPTAPLNLLVQDTPADNGESVDVQFSGSADDGGGANDVISYQLYRSTVAGQFGATSLIQTIPATGAAAYNTKDNVTLSVSAPQDGTAYYYVVTAIDTAAESGRSNQEGPVIPLDNIAPGAPTGAVTATNPAIGGTLDVSWGLSGDDGANNNDVIEYHIYRSTNPALFAPPTVGTVPAQTTTFRDQTAIDGTEYYYMVRAFDGSNESVASAVSNGATSTDGEAPIISNLFPANGATDVARDTKISFVAQDTGAGVNLTKSEITFNVTVNSQLIPGDFTITGTAAIATIEFTPDQPFDYLANVRVDVAVKDLGNNPRATSWSFITAGVPTSSISGRVTQSGAGSLPLAGVRVVAGELEATTDANGDYTIAGVADGNVTVHAVLRGWYFTPQQTAVTVPPDSTGINFIGQPAYDVSGHIVDAVGAGKPGVLVTAGDKSDVTDANGDYLIMDLPANEYAVVPILDGFDFVPASRNVTLGPSPALNVDFTAGIATHTLSGVAQTSTGDRMQAVTVMATNMDTLEETQVSTSVSGQYLFAALPQGRYTITPTKTGFEFRPASREIELLEQMSNVNFIGVPLYTVSLPAGLSMVAVPIVPENSDFRAAFGAATPVARWDNEGLVWITNTLPTHPLLQLAPGRGYWVKPTTAISNDIAGTQVAPTVGFDLSIGSGWTMVGNPYAAALPWANLGVAAGGSVNDYGFIYDRSIGGYRPVAEVSGFGFITSIPDGAGFWMYSTTARSVRVNPLTTTTAAADESNELSLADGDYVIAIQASSAGCTDSCGAAGIVKAAAMLPNGGQLINPPAIGAGIDMYFVSDDGQKLSYDLRSTATNVETWQFEVVNTLGDMPVTIALPDLSGVPSDKQVTLVDTATGERLYARTMQAYTYQSIAGQSRRFALEVSSRTNAPLAISGVSAAQASSGNVAVTYSLSAPATVSMRVMNISGREVKVVTSGTIAASGVNNEVWNLTNSAGARVPAGRYLISINAVTASGQQTQGIVPVQVSR